MAQPLNALFLMLGLSLLSATGVQAAGDPTRPPPAFMPDAPAAASAPQSREPAPALVLQSILLSDGRKRALISGQSLGLGDRIGDARLVQLNETQAVLQGPQGMQILELTPGVRKKAPGSGIARPLPRPTPPQSGDRTQ